MISSQELIDLLTIDRKEKYHFVGQNYKTAWGRVFGVRFLGNHFMQPIKQFLIIE